MKGGWRVVVVNKHHLLDFIVLITFPLARHARLPSGSHAGNKLYTTSENTLIARAVEVSRT